MADENEVQAVETPVDDDPKNVLGGIVGKAVAEAMGPVAEAMGEMAKAVVDLKAQPTLAALPANNGTAEKAIAGEGEPRVKKHLEKFAHVKTHVAYPARTRGDAPHPLAGQPAYHGGRPVHNVTERDLAIIGTFVKTRSLMDRENGNVEKVKSQMPEWEWEFFKEIAHEVPWCGTLARDGESGHDKDVDSMLMKGDELINDATSGGSYMVPVPLDETVWQVPVLHGELYPLVTVKTLTRGASVDGFSMGHVTITSDHTEGAAISLETTTGLVSNLDTTIFPCVGSIQIGLDFEQDSPVNVGQIISQDYAQKLMEWLDTQIAAGDGTTEPQGIVTKSGTTSVSHGSTSAAFTVGDFEKLLFGVPKATRMAQGGRCVFCSDERMYRRAKQVPIGTSDARRVLGMDHEDFRCLGRDWKINESFADGTVCFVNLGFYQMFRRLGLQIRNVTDGLTLARANTRALVMRARFGGQLTIPTACAKMTDGPLTG